MIPYFVKFILHEDHIESFTFESNEKPFKGEVYSVKEGEGKITEYKVQAVLKVIIIQGGGLALLQYHCDVERHQTALSGIGFR